MELYSILVTGANRGIGLEFVRQLSRLPKPPRFIFATYRSKDTLGPLTDIKNASKECQVVLIKMDVQIPKDVVAARKVIEQTVGENGITLLINNSGVAKRQPFPEITEENLLYHFTINTVGPVRVFQNCDMSPSKKARSDVSTIERPTIPQPAPSGIHSKDLKKSLICPLYELKFQRKNHLFRHMRWHESHAASCSGSSMEISEDEALPEVRTVECQPQEIQSSVNEVDPEMTTTKERYELTGASTHEMLPLLQKAAAGASTGLRVSRAAVLNISAALGSITQAGEEFTKNLGVLGYQISKAALNMAMKVISSNVKDQGILVISMCPGWVKTDMGTEQAIITPEDSISAMLQTLQKLDDSHQGSFMDRFGNPYPF